MATNRLQQQIQQAAYRLVVWQLAGVIILSFLALLFSGIKSGYSVFAGGLCYGLPNLVFAWAVFKFAGAKQMTQFMVAFFFGELMKLVLSAILFISVVNSLPVSLLSVFVGFIGAIVSFWIVSIVQFSKPKGVAR